LDGSRILGRERWMARVGATDVEVVVHLPEQSPVRLQELIDFLKSLPPGTRSKEDIDRQIEEDRGSWDR
jgi:intergrase/recombinase